MIYEGVVYTWVLGGDPFSGWSALMTSRPLKLVNDSFKRKTSRLLRKGTSLPHFCASTHYGNEIGLPWTLSALRKVHWVVHPTTQLVALDSIAPAGQLLHADEGSLP